jgi:hypothetical protein
MLRDMNFAFWAFSEVDIPALCVAPPLFGRNSYVEITGAWPCLHKILSGARRWNSANFVITEFSEVYILLLSQVLDARSTPSLGETDHVEHGPAVLV